MLIAEHLHLVRGTSVILRDLSLSIEPGMVTVLLGRNGAGKSTLLKALAGEFCGLVGARSMRMRGTLTLDGIALETIKPARLAQLRAVLPQASYPAFPFSAEEIVLLGRYPHARRAGALSREDHEIARQALELAGASALAGREITSLSGGEYGRVQFARVLAQLWPVSAPAGTAPPPPSRYLLLDEPTAALDLTHQHHLLGTVRELARAWGLGVLAIVHDPNLAARHADRIAMLADGTIIAADAPNAIMRPELIEQCYGFAVRMLDAGAGAPPVMVPA